MLTRRSVLGLFPLLLACACGSGSSPGSGGAGAGGTGGAASGGSAGTAGADAGGAGGGGGASGAAGTGGTSGDGGAQGPIVDIVTSMGTMSFELDPTHEPITTANFLSYVNDGFYADTIFHRVIPDFVIQGGGFTSGLNAKSVKAPIKLETSPDVLHDYGAISMARTSNPDSATSQFFVVNNQSGAHSLDGQYAAFGHLISGSDVLDAISQVATHSVGNFDDVPVTDVTIVSAKER